MPIVIKDKCIAFDSCFRVLLFFVSVRNMIYWGNHWESVSYDQRLTLIVLG